MLFNGVNLDYSDFKSGPVQLQLFWECICYVYSFSFCAQHLDFLYFVEKYGILFLNTHPLLFHVFAPTSLPGLVLSFVFKFFSPKLDRGHLSAKPRGRDLPSIEPNLNAVISLVLLVCPVSL